MLFSKSFLDALDQLSSNITAQGDTSKSVLDLSIQAWCDKLGLKEEANSFIVTGFRNQKIELEIHNGLTGRILKISHLSLNHFFRTYSKEYISVHDLIDKLDQRIISEKFKMKIYILSAFVIVAVGYALFLFKENSEDKKQINKKNGVSQHRSSYSFGNNFVLLLVVNVKHEGIVRALKDDSNINSKLADELYHATQDIWVGSKDSFENSSINNLFSIQRDETTKYSSEYDVYFIKITLSEKDPGFEKDVSQLKRSDAFKRLPQIAKAVEVSNRLPSQSYENIGVYSR